MLACYRDQGVADPKVFAAAIVQVLTSYPEQVVRVVTAPGTGLPSRLKFLPSIAEVRDACEAEVAPIRREAERRSRYVRTQALIAGPPPEPRKSLEEMQALYGKEWGIERKADRKPSPTKTLEQLREEAAEPLEVSETLKAYIEQNRPPRAEEAA